MGIFAPIHNDTVESEQDKFKFACNLKALNIKEVRDHLSELVKKIDSNHLSFEERKDY